MGHIRSGLVVTLFLLCLYICEGFSQTSWSSLTNPTTNLSLSMGGNTSTFNDTSAVSNFFSWVNTTSGTGQVSPAISLCANYTGSSEDCWFIQNNTASNKGLIFGHTGQSNYSGSGGGVSFDQSINTLTMHGQLNILNSPSGGALPSQSFIAMQAGAKVATAVINNFFGSFSTSVGSPAGPFNGMGLAIANGNFYPVASAPISTTAGHAAVFYSTGPTAANPLLNDPGAPPVLEPTTATRTLWTMSSSTGLIGSPVTLLASTLATGYYRISWRFAEATTGNCTTPGTFKAAFCYSDPDTGLTCTLGATAYFPYVANLAGTTASGSMALDSSIGSSDVWSTVTNIYASNGTASQYQGYVSTGSSGGTCSTQATVQGTVSVEGAL